MRKTLSFRSKFEKTVYDLVIKNGLQVEYEPFKLKYTTNNTYLPDFQLPNGILIEVKGYFDPRSRSKMMAVIRSNPSLDIRFVFMNSRTKISKYSKMSYGEWCDKHGYLYADGVIPLSWFKERENKE